MSIETMANRVKNMVKGNKKVKADKKRVSIDVNDFYQRVERKAYELYELKGFLNGHDLEDWLEAERIIEAEIISDSESKILEKIY